MRGKGALIKAGILVFVFALAGAAPAQFTYTTNSGVITITGYTGSPTRLNVPGTINGYPVALIGFSAFANFTSLTTAILPASITNVGNGAFGGCPKLTGVYFQGNVPGLGGSDVFFQDPKAIVYYLPGTTGWSSRLSGYPTVLWNPQADTGDVNFGARTNQFGFDIVGSSNLVIVVEACTNLASPIWLALATNILNNFVGTNGISYFSDPQWTNYPRRCYRFRSP